jgi:hypothetical protein
MKWTLYPCKRSAVTRVDCYSEQMYAADRDCALTDSSSRHEHYAAQAGL